MKTIAIITLATIGMSTDSILVMAGAIIVVLILIVKK
jgi:hypothetical protein